MWWFTRAHAMVRFGFGVSVCLIRIMIMLVLGCLQSGLRLLWVTVCCTIRVNIT